MAERRDVAIAEVFFYEEAGSKVRPCIMLSDKKYHESGYCIVALITSENDEYCLPITEMDADCRFYRGSCARFDCCSRIPLENLEKIIGRVRPEFYDRLVGKMTETIRR